MDFPGGQRFAFTVLDDTDVASVDNVAPVYRLLEDLGMRATKTVWPLACPEGSPRFDTSQTLEEEAYLAFVLDLQRRGFEITWHGATMESSTRERTLAGMERFRELVGTYPRIHANHATNRENLYWGAERVDDLLVRAFARLAGQVPRDHYQGHVPGSPFWWGDVARERIRYARNLTFDDIDLGRINPSMPYHDPRRPLAPFWFSATDAEDRGEFERLLEPRKLDRLEAQGGFCIVATHFGKDYAHGGRVHDTTRARLEALARRGGWFPTVGQLLDWLLERRHAESLPPREWSRMQWLWMRDLLRRRVRMALRARRERTEMAGHRQRPAPVTAAAG